MEGSRPPSPLAPGDPPQGGATRPPIPPSPAQAAAMAAVARSTKLTGRAALLAVVICAIALSLAYPVREYIAQRQQIDQLLAQQQTMSVQVKALQEQDARLGQTWYVEQRARDELHMCFPDERCYKVIPGQPAPAVAAGKNTAADPWYARLWESVRRADAAPGR
jgi:cell division protein FtsB